MAHSSPLKFEISLELSQLMQLIFYLTYAIDILFQYCYSTESFFLNSIQHENLQNLLNLTKKNNNPRLISKKDINFIDIGAGKGGFSIFMATDLRIHTLTIEASLSHASHLKNRITCLINQKKVEQTKFDLLELCIGYVTKNTTVEGIVSNSMTFSQFMETVCNYEKQIQKKPKKKFHKKIETDSENLKILSPDELKFAEQSQKPRVIQGELAIETKNSPIENISSHEFFTVGLHACGDLSFITHEMCLNSSKIRGAISIPCCYQHLSNQYLPCLPENQQIFDILYGDNTEQQHNLTKKKY
jgi:hypothetical protein